MGSSESERDRCGSEGGGGEDGRCEGEGDGGSGMEGGSM